MKILLKSETYHAIATHDESLIKAAKEFARSQRIPKDHFEFQMLYGVNPNLRCSIVRRGYPMRVYVPFGKQWFNYSTRRLQENPNMVWHIVKALFVRG